MFGDSKMCVAGMLPIETDGTRSFHLPGGAFAGTERNQAGRRSYRRSYRITVGVGPTGSPHRSWPCHCLHNTGNTAERKGIQGRYLV
jgi:hypothetical protein